MLSVDFHGAWLLPGAVFGSATVVDPRGEIWSDPPDGLLALEIADYLQVVDHIVLELLALQGLLAQLDLKAIQ